MGVSWAFSQWGCFLSVASLIGKPVVTWRFFNTEADSPIPYDQTNL